MKLPEIKLPLYEVKILSKKEPIKFRPFTVREEQIMRMAVESSDINSILLSLKQVINNCVIDDIDVDDMAMVDMETIFLHLRARSIGETGSQYFKCKNEITLVDGTKKECGMLIEVPINFLEVPVINAGIDSKLQLDEDLGVKMKYPTVALAGIIGSVKDPHSLEITMIANCIDLIYTKTEVYSASDCTQEELVDFLLKLPTPKYDVIKQFCEKAPKTQLIVEKDCGKCGWHHTFTLEGIYDFFE